MAKSAEARELTSPRPRWCRSPSGSAFHPARPSGAIMEALTGATRWDAGSRPSPRSSPRATRPPPNLTFPVVKVLDYEARWEELERSANPFAVLVMTHLKTQATQRAPAERLAR